MLQQQRRADALLKIQRVFLVSLRVCLILVSKITEGGKDHGQKEGLSRMIIIVYVPLINNPKADVTQNAASESLIVRY